MQPKSSVLFKVLLNRFHPGAGETFLKRLPPDEAKEIARQATSSQDLLPALSFSHDLLERTHYSWLAPYLQQFPQFLRPAIIAALSEPQASGLKKLLKISAVQENLSPAIKEFLLGLLWKKWNPKDAVPLGYLPPSTLQPLLELNKNELVDLIDFLALYDLTDSIRHMVDKKSLKALYACLNTRQQQFIRLCLHKKEKITSEKLTIDKWDGNPESLQSMLHRRGIQRLGKALCGQHPDFIWHIIHTLDTGRGSIISQFYQDKEIPGISPLLAQQVISVINFLKPKSTP